MRLPLVHLPRQRPDQGDSGRPPGRVPLVLLAGSPVEHHRDGRRACPT